MRLFGIAVSLNKCDIPCDAPVRFYAFPYFKERNESRIGIKDDIANSKTFVTHFYGSWHFYTFIYNSRNVLDFSVCPELQDPQIRSAIG